MAAKQKRATVYLDPRLYRALRLKSAETWRSLSALVNDAVRQALAEDAEDLAAFKERAKEPNLSFETILKQSEHVKKGLRQAKARQFASDREVARAFARWRRWPEGF